MKTEKNNKLRGTVLFTVVAVMALLIIFLTGTLALATASSNRAHKSYSSSQASYTAKTAITSFTRAMETSAEVRNKIVSLGLEDNPAVIHPTITFRDGTKQDKTIGLVGFWDESGDWHDNQITVERETIQDPADPTNPDARVPKTEWVYYNPAEYGEEGEPHWVEIERVKITATARVGREESTVTAYLTKMPGTPELPGDPPENPSTHRSNTGGIKGLNTVGTGVFNNGGRYTGGMGIGLTGDGISDEGRVQYLLDNSVELDTTLTFINGDLLCKTGTFGISVDQADDTPVSQTVVNGNLLVQNDTFVELKYTMDHNFTQKQIPYLYVDGAMGFLSASRIVVNNAGPREYGQHTGTPASPYNVFVGTLRADKNEYIVHGDIYMMDDYEPTKPNNTYTVSGMNGDQPFQKGDNYFGNPQGGKNQLYKWAYDTVNRTESQNYSEGGNIFCNGQLNLSGAEIDGDVRVKKDCVIKDTHIHGNLVVGGTLTATGLTVDGIVYCDNVHGYSGDGADVQTATYKRVRNVYEGPDEYKPADDAETVDWSGVKIMEYPEREKFVWNTGGDHVNSSWQPTDVNGNGTDNFWGELYYSWVDDWSPETKVCVDKDGFVELKYPDQISNMTPEELSAAYDSVMTVQDVLDNLQKVKGTDRDNITLEVVSKVLRVEDPERGQDGPQKTYNVLKVPALDDADQPKRDADGNVIYRETSIRTDKKSVVLSSETGLPIEDAVVPHFEKADFDGNRKQPVEDVGAQMFTWYNEQNHQEVPEAIATAPPPEPIEGDKVQGLGNYKNEIYPEKMEREKIYGTYETEDHTFKEADEETKIIKNIYEVRVDLGLKRNGEVNGYPSTLVGAAGETVANKLEQTVDGEIVSKATGIAIENNKKMNAGDTSIWNGNVITGDCVIKGNLQGAEMTGNNGTYPSKIIEINPQGKNIWVVLDNVSTGNEVEIHVNRFYKAPGEAVEKECGKVQFFIKGTLKGDKLAIIDKKIVDEKPLEINMVTHKNTDFGIEFYGEEDSYIQLSNPSTLCGTFKSPYTDFSSTDLGKYEVNYTDEYGINWPTQKVQGSQKQGGDQTSGRPTIIGNALFRNVTETKNNFAIFYTETGQSGDSGNEGDGGDGEGGTTTTTTKVIRAATGEKWFFEFYSAT